MKILMVDDSAADRRFYRLLLDQDNGAAHEIFEASAAAAGLATCREVRPDCVLLDYRLPDMDGLEFLALLHPDGPNTAPAVAVVMLTGVAGDEMAVKALRAGAHDYLTKDGITAEGLRLAVEKATQKVELTRSLREERDRLARALAEKEVLIKEVHHRVKNNLQVIASLLRLQTASVEGPAATALRDSQHRVEAMAMIHEQLYESQNLREIDLERNARLLLSNVFTSFGVDVSQISPLVDVATPSGGRLELGVDQAIPVGLILNELVSNALKHAFPDGRRGAIAIRARREDGQVRISVTDDGIGIPEEVDIRKSRSLGLKIVDILTRQLKGTFAVERAPVGACFTLSFPER